MKDNTKFIISLTAFILLSLSALGLIVWATIASNNAVEKRNQRSVDVECMAVMAPIHPTGITRGNIQRLVDFCTEE